jgi:hypothetical protein
MRASAFLRAICLVVLCARAQAQPLAVGDFSRLAPGGLPPGWRALRPAPHAPDTRYRLVRDEGMTVLRADAEGSMSALVRDVRIDPRRYPLLRWRWKVAAPLANADMKTRRGDDYAARIYVLFDYDVGRLPIGDRVQLKLARALHGSQIPAAALNYVWDNRYPVGTLQPNVYTDRARLIVVESGRAKAGRWVIETRDLALDFRAAFGEEPPDVIGIAVASDTDNTGETATAWYGNIEFLQKPNGGGTPPAPAVPPTGPGSAGERD